MGKEEVINYVMNTPNNSNRAVLSTMLDDVGEKLPAITVEDNGKVLTVVNGTWDKAEASGGGDKGYECTETRTLLTDETCTFETSADMFRARLSYSDFIDADKLFVTFDSVEYGPISKGSIDDGTYYGDVNIAEGAINFDRFPFMIGSSSSVTGGSIVYAYAETGGEHAIKIETVETVTTTTPCFEKAVQSVMTPLMINFMEADAETGNVYFDKTFGEVTDAYFKGRPCILNYNFEDHSGFFSAAAILDKGKVSARVIFPRDIESMALYADVDTGRLYGKETDMR